MRPCYSFQERKSRLALITAPADDNVLKISQLGQTDLFANSVGKMYIQRSPLERSHDESNLVERSTPQLVTLSTLHNYLI